MGSPNDPLRMLSRKFWWALVTFLALSFAALILWSSMVLPIIWLDLGWAALLIENDSIFFFSKLCNQLVLCNFVLLYNNWSLIYQKKKKNPLVKKEKTKGKSDPGLRGWKRMETRLVWIDGIPKCLIIVWSIVGWRMKSGMDPMKLKINWSLYGVVFFFMRPRAV